MKTVSEYLLPRPDDPVRQFPVYMPRSCEVRVYGPDRAHGEWRVVVKVNAIDVVTDEFADFETRWSTTRDPTRSEIAQVVINMIAHEVQEQMGLDPHGAHVVIPKARNP